MFMNVSPTVKTRFATVTHSLQAILIIILLVPFLRDMSPIANINNTPLYIAYLPVSLFIALACVYGFRIFPALSVGVFFVFRHELSVTVVQTIYLTLSVVVPLYLSVRFLHLKLGARYRSDITNKKGVAVHLICMGFIYPLLMAIALYIVGWTSPIQDHFQYYFSDSGLMMMLLNLQSLTLPAVVFTPIFYHVLRMLTSYNYARKFIFNNVFSLFKAQNRKKNAIWLFCLVLLLITYLNFHQSSILSSYVIPVIFLVFIYGFINLNATVVMTLWSVSIYMLIQYDSDFVVLIEKDRLLICFSALFMVLTIANTWLSSMRSQLTSMIYELYAASRREPLTSLPNMQALNDDLKHGMNDRCLCYIKLFAIDKIEKHLGLIFKSKIKMALYSQLKRLAGPDARIYATPGSDLLLSLPDNNIKSHLAGLLTRLNQVQLSDKEKRIDVFYGISWMNVDQVQDVYQMICGLEFLATSKGENKITALHENDEQVEKYTSLDVRKLDEIKHAINNDGIHIYAQKIQSTDGQDDYYEVLSRLYCNDNIVTPDVFLPLITEFNICAQFDFRVFEAFLKQYQQRPSRSKNTKYSLNIMPETLGDDQTARKIIALFHSFSAPAENFVFEITEEPLFFNESNTLNNIRHLRRAGFAIAIDDFGKGYANYERLKVLDADVLKIDGMFIRNILSNKLDYIIVKSIMEIAQAKGMKVVAEFVESQDHAKLLTDLRVDYLQGYFIGKPEPLADTF